MHKVWRPLHSRRQTGREIYSLVSRFSGDLRRIIGDQGKPLADYLLGDFFDYVRNLQYKRDDRPIEIVARPRIAIERATIEGGIDCKKKSVLMGSWFKENGFKPLEGFRFVAVSRKPNREFHHVFPQVFLNDNWLNADATYSYQRLFEPVAVTNMEVLTP